MAQLAFAVAGTAIGAMFGAPQLGFLAGSLVGTLLFPQKGPDVTSEGPRLGDLSVSSSAYGAPIAIGYGTLRMGGNIIWSSGIREQKTVKKVSGGKGMGGGSQKSVTYSYFASFAIAFGEGPAEDVLRIWADGKLIFDKTGSSPQTAKRNLRFRLHKGDESQLPDPLIESQVGAGRAPAHRGLCYLVFEDLALADFGNRIPTSPPRSRAGAPIRSPTRASISSPPAKAGTFPATSAPSSPSTGHAATATSSPATSIPMMPASAASTSRLCARTGRRGCATSAPRRPTPSPTRSCAARTATSTSTSAPATRGRSSASIRTR